MLLQVYLVDYGLAHKYSPDSVHKAYKEDPKKAHDGTIEFTSRDAHKGVSMWLIICYFVHSGQVEDLFICSGW